MVDFPFIVKLESSGYDEFHYFFQTEYIQGVNFQDALEELDTLSTVQTQFYAGLIVLILHYLHKRCIVYRDLKPENLMCDYKGYLKCIDFGTAKILANSSEGTLGSDDAFEHIERTFTQIGTPLYMAPEMIKLCGYSYAVDYWSFGTHP